MAKRESLFDKAHKRNKAQDQVIINPLSGIPSSQLAQDTPAALAAEIDAQIGEPCHWRGCTLVYQLDMFVMCY